MKLYVWESVFCDWTCGLAFAIAESKEDAIESIIKKHGDNNYIRKELHSIDPKIHKLDRKQPVGYCVFGGG